MTEKNAMSQVPILEFVDRATNKTCTLTQSMAIIEFLDSVFPSGVTIFPKNPLLRAQVTQV